MPFWNRPKPTIDSITFQTENWELKEESNNHRAWLANAHDPVLLRYFPKPLQYPYNYSDLEAARQFYTTQAIKNGGVMLSVDFVHRGGVDWVKGVFKYRSPQPESMAMYFVGILAALFRKFSFQINTESLEMPPTGMREAAVTVLKNEPPATEQEPVFVENVSELFAQMRNKPVVKLIADEEEYDTEFPDHPLSKVRSLQKHILDTVIIDDVVKKSHQV